MVTNGTILLVVENERDGVRRAYSLDRAGYDTRIATDQPPVDPGDDVECVVIAADVSVGDRDARERNGGSQRKERSNELKWNADGPADGEPTGDELRDGVYLAATIRSHRPQLPIVVFAGSGDEAIASRAFSAGVDEYVQQSDGPTALSAAVDRALGERREGGGPSVDAPLKTVEGDELLTMVEGDAPPTTAEGNEPPSSIGGPTENADDCSRTTAPERDDESHELTHLRAAVEAAADMIYVLDADGRIVLANESLANNFGYTQSEVVGMAVSELISDEVYETSLCLIKSLLESEETDHGRYEFDLDRPNGAVRHVENVVSIRRDADGAFTGTVGVIRDVTQRTRQERELQAQNERLEEFASIVSHDLRNPLNVMLGKIEMLRNGGGSAQLDDLEECTHHMATLIDDLLTLAREGRDVADTQCVSLERVVLDAWRHVDTEDGRISFDDELGTIEADPDRLTQLFENLFRNAIEHGSPGRSDSDDASEDALEHGPSSRSESLRGSEDAETQHAHRAIAQDVPGTTLKRSTPREVDRNSADRDGATPNSAGESTDEANSEPVVSVTVERLEDGFAVADDGPGIDPDVVDDVFDRGVTTSDAGTGFGLSIVEQIVDGHGWAIDVDAAADGARFVVSI